MGIKSADLNVGLVDLEEYRAARFGPYGAPPQEETEDNLDHLYVEVALHDARLRNLEAFHYPIDGNPEEPVDPPEEPLPPPLTSVPAVVTKDPHTVAWARTEVNESGVPVIETNAYLATKDPYLKFLQGQEIRVQPKAVTSDGNRKWFELDLVPLHGYPKLYVRKDHVMKKVY